MFSVLSTHDVVSLSMTMTMLSEASLNILLQLVQILEVQYY